MINTTCKSINLFCMFWVDGKTYLNLEKMHPWQMCPRGQILVALKLLAELAPTLELILFTVILIFNITKTLKPSIVLWDRVAMKVPNLNKHARNNLNLSSTSWIFDSSLALFGVYSSISCPWWKKFGQHWSRKMEKLYKERPDSPGRVQQVC